MQTELTTEMLPASRNIVWKILERTVIDSIEQDIKELKLENVVIAGIIALIESKDVVSADEVAVIAKLKVVHEQNLTKLEQFSGVVENLKKLKEG